jgi:hypothetical protein
MHWALPPFEESKGASIYSLFCWLTALLSLEQKRLVSVFGIHFPFPLFSFVSPSVSLPLFPYVLRFPFPLFPFFGAEIPLEDFEKKRILNPTKYGVTDYYYYPLGLVTCTYNTALMF